MCLEAPEDQNAVLSSVSAWSLKTWCLKGVRKVLYITAHSYYVSCVLRYRREGSRAHRASHLETSPLQAGSNEAELHLYPLQKALPCSMKRERAELQGSFRDLEHHRTDKAAANTWLERQHNSNYYKVCPVVAVVIPNTPQHGSAQSILCANFRSSLTLP